MTGYRFAPTGLRRRLRRLGRAARAAERDLQAGWGVVVEAARRLANRGVPRPVYEPARARAGPARPR